MLHIGSNARAILDGRPMLFRNPFPVGLNCPDPHATNRTRLKGKLISVSVSSKGDLRLIAESPFARLGYLHDSPWNLQDCALSL